MITKSKEEIKASSLLILSLFIPLTWHFIPADIELPYLFFNETCNCFSLFPEEYKTFNLRDSAPFYCPFIIMSIFAYCSKHIGNMYAVICGIRISILKIHVLFLALQGLDLMLSFLQAKYYRTFFIVIGISCQLIYLFQDESRTNSKLPERK